jgi:hypothetical protein
MKCFVLFCFVCWIKVSIFEGSLALSSPFVESWLDTIASYPRVFPFLEKNHTLISGLENVHTLFSLIDTNKQTVFVYCVMWIFGINNDNIMFGVGRSLHNTQLTFIVNCLWFLKTISRSTYQPQVQSLRFEANRFPLISLSRLLLQLILCFFISCSKYVKNWDLFISHSLTHSLTH